MSKNDSPRVMPERDPSVPRKLPASPSGPSKRPEQGHQLRFVNKVNNSYTMPVIVTDPSGTRIGVTGSHNSFANKEEVNKYLGACRTLAKHFFLDAKLEETLKNFELVKEVTYSTKISL
jgi:hypothetical protein